MAYTKGISRDEIARFLEIKKPEARNMELISLGLAIAEIKAAHDVIGRCNMSIMELESELALEKERTAALEAQLQEAKDDRAAPPDAREALLSAMAGA